MHGSVMDFLRKVQQQYPEHFEGTTVLEFGSRDINGSPREVFSNPKEYIGVDCHEGKGVDWVGICHEFEGLEDGSCDVVVSTEMLEHDPYVEKTVLAAHKKLRPGGLFIGTCAGKLRGAHHLEDSPTPGYYGGVDPDDITCAMWAAGNWSHVDAKFVRGKLDTAWVGVKAEDEPADD